MKKILLQMTAGAILLAHSAPAFATFQCYGTLTNVYLSANGNVYILPSYAPSYTQICNVKTEWKGISKDICWGWFSQVNNALVESRQLRVAYTVSGACDALPTYGAAPAPSYVMLY